MASGYQTDSSVLENTSWGGELFRVLDTRRFLTLCLEVRVAIWDGVEFRSQQRWLWAKACSTIRLSKKNALSEDKIMLSNSMPEKHNHLSNRRKRNRRGRTRRESQRKQQTATVQRPRQVSFRKYRQVNASVPGSHKEINYGLKSNLRV